jgi:hypothetical protein
MCDYSLNHVASRAAAVGDELISTTFPHTSSHGFATESDKETAVCLLPGTELAFEMPVSARVESRTLYDLVFGFKKKEGPDSKIVTFRQINKDDRFKHHDALEFADGSILMVHSLAVGQKATVLQLPAAPKTETEAKEQTRLEVVA